MSEENRTKLLCNIKNGEHFRTEDGKLYMKTEKTKVHQGKKMYRCGNAGDGWFYLPAKLRVEPYLQH